jgi:hypothetical protein
MGTATLADDGPTTTITFEAFKVIDFSLNAKTFVPITYPENEGREVIFVGQWERYWKVDFELKDDSTWPASGDSAADKRKELVTLLLTGGDDEWLYTLTFDSEDSRPGSSVTETYTGKVKRLHIRSRAGDDLSVIKGSFEFWEDDSS